MKCRTFPSQFAITRVPTVRFTVITTITQEESDGYSVNKYWKRGHLRGHWHRNFRAGVPHHRQIHSVQPLERNCPGTQHRTGYLAGSDVAWDLHHHCVGGPLDFGNPAFHYRAVDRRLRAYL